jgi:hypothetical protein
MKRRHIRRRNEQMFAAFMTFAVGLALFLASATVILTHH